MTASEPTIELDQRFSSEGAQPLPWTSVIDVLESAEIFWLSTVRGDGRPHVTPLPAMWLDGALYFCTGPKEQKTRNIQANPRCALTTGSNEFRSGIDVVVEGKAFRLTEEDMLTRLATIWLSKLDWRFDVRRGDSGIRRHPEVMGIQTTSPWRWCSVWRRARCSHSARVSYTAKPATASEA